MTGVLASNFVYEFVTLFVILDPVATVPIFLAVTNGLSRRQSLTVAFYALGVSFLILFFFVVGGNALLDALKIPMPSFQLAGSIVLFLFSIDMVLGKVQQQATAMPSGATMMERAIYPLAVPGIAGAGAILTVVLLTDTTIRTIPELAATTATILLCLIVFFILFALAQSVFRVLGRSGVEIVTRVFGLVLASIAVHNVIVAIKGIFHLP